MADSVDDLDLISSSLKNYVVSPLNAFGIGGLVFDVEGETTADLDTDITDHYLEDNTFVQDNITIKPKIMVLKSYVGELVHQGDQSSNPAIQQAVQKLTIVSQFLPVLSAGASQAKSFLDSGESVADIQLSSVNQVANYWGAVKNLVGGLTNKQQQAYQYLDALRVNKILVSVQTPFEFISNMAVKNVRAVQTEATKYQSDIIVTLKQIRSVNELTTPQQAAQNGGKSTQSSSPTDSQANVYGPPAPPVVAQGRAADQIQNLTIQGNMAGVTPSFVTDAVSSSGTLSQSALPDVGVSGGSAQLTAAQQQTVLHSAYDTVFKPANVSQLGSINNSGGSD